MKISSGIGLGVAVWVLAAGLAGAETKPAAPEPQPPAELVQKAEKGEAAAQRDLGLFYRQLRSDDNETSKRNNENADKWLKLAAEQGDAVAQYRYATGFCGWYYALNRAEECLSWLDKAAAQGVAGAQRALGLIYLRGGYKNGSKETAVAKDADKAMAFLKKAVAQDDTEAAYLLGHAYSTAGKEPEKVVELYEKAAGMMHTRAMVSLADMYLHGTAHVKKNTPKALELYREAADLFDIDAQFELAHMYMDGEHMPKDYKKAAELFRQIDENTHVVDYEDNNLRADIVVDAKLHLGLIYHDGRGVEKDEKEAMHYYRQAAMFDSPAAQYLIAHAYEHGLGVPRDFITAYAWYARAQDNAFRPFWLDIIDGNDPGNHPMPGLDAEKALEALAARMNAKDLERARRYAAAEENTRMQLESAQMWQQIP